MIVYTLPPKSAKLFSAAGVPSAPVSGLKFTVNTRFKICDTVPGLVYYLDRLSFSPSVPEPDYISGLDIAAETPQLTIENENGEQVGGAVKLISAMGERPLELWYSSDSSGALYARVRGVVYQNSALVTFSEIRLAVSVTGYEIPSTIMAGAFRDSISRRAPENMRGGTL
jgi:hypothetical protein